MNLSDVYTEMRALPIFKPEMRKANRDGLKSQTRRVMDPQPPRHSFTMCPNEKFNVKVSELFYMHCPYGKVGDYVYMREPLYHGFGGVAYYKDDGVMVRHALTGNPITWRWNVNTLSGMFMPREAARFIYQYESIRVERVQEITRDDAKAEGLNNVWSWNKDRDPKYFRRGVLNPYVANYSVLWDEINGERGFGWDVNPWVWVLEYKVVT